MRGGEGRGVSHLQRCLQGAGVGHLPDEVRVAHHGSNLGVY